MSKISPEDADALGRLVDRLENGLMARTLPVAAKIHVEGLAGIMTDVRDELKAWLIGQGHDFWETH